MERTKLPFTNERGYYEIRLESIGGLGANLCGKMLGELGLRYLGLNSAGFSSYGSEKTGTPVKAYVRYSDASREIRVHAPVEQPHMLGVFHEALLGKKQVLAGCNSRTRVVLNTALDCGQAAGRYGLPLHALYCIPAQAIAMECHARINVVMLGAIGRVMGFVDVEQLCGLCVDALGRKYPDALAGNLEGIRRGFAQVKGYEGKDSAHDNPFKEIDAEECRQEWGYKTAPEGGINPRYGNSVLADLSPSRQGYVPVFLPEKCINCALCDSTCPDMVFQFKKGIYKGKEMMVNRGLDYYHCKGCLRCVDVCPTHALITGKEEDYPVLPYFMPDQELLYKPDSYDEMGANGYITSESYLTVKRKDGGEV